jgi:hypothetical protein
MGSLLDGWVDVLVRGWILVKMIRGAPSVDGGVPYFVGEPNEYGRVLHLGGA